MGDMTTKNENLLRFSRDVNIIVPLFWRLLKYMALEGIMTNKQNTQKQENQGF